jgi:hypothetical protein
MVMREYQSEGPLTDAILPLIGINNQVAILAFILLNNTGLSTDATIWKALVQVFSLSVGMSTKKEVGGKFSGTISI